MKKATIANLKDNLSRYLAYVRRGGRVVIFNRDTPIAELVPVRRIAVDELHPLGEHLRTLEREGIVRRGTGQIGEELLKPPRGRRSGVLQALLKERASGR